jgi:hypothetical protein
MWQHCINISCREYKMELDIGINQLIDTLNNDNDVLRFYTVLRLSFMLIIGYVLFVY